MTTDAHQKIDLDHFRNYAIKNADLDEKNFVSRTKYFLDNYLKQANSELEKSKSSNAKTAAKNEADYKDDMNLIEMVIGCSMFGMDDESRESYRSDLEEMMGKKLPDNMTLLKRAVAAAFVYKKDYLSHVKGKPNDRQKEVLAKLDHIKVDNNRLRADLLLESEDFNNYFNTCSAQIKGNIKYHGPKGAVFTGQVIDEMVDKYYEMYLKAHPEVQPVEIKSDKKDKKKDKKQDKKQDKMQDKKKDKAVKKAEDKKVKKEDNSKSPDKSSVTSKVKNHNLKKTVSGGKGMS